jgi:hypothetical protein
MRNKNMRRRDDVDQRILTQWDDITDEFADKSTEFVIQMTADRSNVDYGRVVDALSRKERVDE